MTIIYLILSILTFICFLNLILTLTLCNFLIKTTDIVFKNLEDFYYFESIKKSNSEPKKGLVDP